MKTVGLALLIALALAAASAAAKPRTAHGPLHAHAVHDTARSMAANRSSGPLVLLLPGGGWQHADAQAMTPWVRDFQNHGIRARAITYPLRDVVGAIAYVRDIAARESGPVILYGISAGGTLAAALAATGDVDGAVDVAGPTDFTRWITPAGLLIMGQIHMSKVDRRAASPYWRLNGRQSPQLIQCGLLDPYVSYDQCAGYAAAASRVQSDTQLQPMINAHSQFPADMRAARAWITARWPTPATASDKSNLSLRR